VIIHGRVQGVFFRAETRKMADALGIRGWARNNPDGTVEALFEADENRRRNAEMVPQKTSLCSGHGRGPEMGRISGRIQRL